MVLSFEKSLKKGKRQKELVEFCEKLEITYPSENALINSLFYTISIQKQTFRKNRLLLQHPLAIHFVWVNQEYSIILPYDSTCLDLFLVVLSKLNESDKKLSISDIQLSFGNVVILPTCASLSSYDISTDLIVSKRIDDSKKGYRKQSLNDSTLFLSILSSDLSYSLAEAFYSNSFQSFETLILYFPPTLVSSIQLVLKILASFPSPQFTHLIIISPISISPSYIQNIFSTNPINLHSVDIYCDSFQFLYDENWCETELWTSYYSKNPKYQVNQLSLEESILPQASLSSILSETQFHYYHDHNHVNGKIQYHDCWLMNHEYAVTCYTSSSIHLHQLHPNLFFEYEGHMYPFSCPLHLKQQSVAERICKTLRNHGILIYYDEIQILYKESIIEQDQSLQSLYIQDNDCLLVQKIRDVEMPSLLNNIQLRGKTCWYELTISSEEDINSFLEIVNSDTLFIITHLTLIFGSFTSYSLKTSLQQLLSMLASSCLPYLQVLSLVYNTVNVKEEWESCFLCSSFPHLQRVFVYILNEDGYSFEEESGSLLEMEGKKQIESISSFLASEEEKEMNKQSKQERIDLSAKPVVIASPARKKEEVDVTPVIKKEEKPVSVTMSETKPKEDSMETTKPTVITSPSIKKENTRVKELDAMIEDVLSIQNVKPTVITPPASKKEESERVKELDDMIDDALSIQDMKPVVSASDDVKPVVSPKSETNPVVSPKPETKPVVSPKPETKPAIISQPVVQSPRPEIISPKQSTSSQVIDEEKQNEIFYSEAPILYVDSYPIQCINGRKIEYELSQDQLMVDGMVYQHYTLHRMNRLSPPSLYYDPTDDGELFKVSSFEGRNYPMIFDCSMKYDKLVHVAIRNFARYGFSIKRHEITIKVDGKLLPANKKINDIKRHEKPDLAVNTSKSKIQIKTKSSAIIRTNEDLISFIDDLEEGYYIDTDELYLTYETKDMDLINQSIEALTTVRFDNLRSIELTNPALLNISMINELFRYKTSSRLQDIHFLYDEMNVEYIHNQYSPPSSKASLNLPLKSAQSLPSPLSSIPLIITEKESPSIIPNINSEEAFPSIVPSTPVSYPSIIVPPIPKPLSKVTSTTKKPIPLSTQLKIEEIQKPVVISLPSSRKNSVDLSSQSISSKPTSRKNTIDITSQSISSKPSSRKNSVDLSSQSTATATSKPTSRKNSVDTSSLPSSQPEEIRQPIQVLFQNRQDQIMIGLTKFSVKIESSLKTEGNIPYLMHRLTYSCLSENRLGNTRGSGDCKFFYRNQMYAIPILNSIKKEDYYQAIATQLLQHGIYVPIESMSIQYENHEITKSIIKNLLKLSHFTLQVSSSYELPPAASADKDLYELYDFSQYSSFKESITHGNLISYKKMAFHVNDEEEIKAIVMTLQEVCLPYLYYIRFYLPDVIQFDDFSLFDELFRYNNLSSLSRIGILCIAADYIHDGIVLKDKSAKQPLSSSIPSSTIPSTEPVQEESVKQPAVSTTPCLIDYLQYEKGFYTINPSLVNNAFSPSTNLSNDETFTQVSQELSSLFSKLSFTKYDAFDKMIGKLEYEYVSLHQTTGVTGVSGIISVLVYKRKSENPILNVNKSGKCMVNATKAGIHIPFNWKDVDSRNVLKKAIVTSFAQIGIVIPFKGLILLHDGKTITDDQILHYTINPLTEIEIEYELLPENSTNQSMVLSFTFNTRVQFNKLIWEGILTSCERLLINVDTFNTLQYCISSLLLVCLPSLHTLVFRIQETLPDYSIFDSLFMYYNYPHLTTILIQSELESALQSSAQPSTQSSVQSSVQPSVQPSTQPPKPSVQSPKPSTQPSKPSVQPSKPSVQPSTQPSVQSSKPSKPSSQSSKSSSEPSNDMGPLYSTHHPFTAYEWEYGLDETNTTIDSISYPTQIYTIRRSYQMDPLRFPQDICNADCLFNFAPNYSFEYNYKKYGFYSNQLTTVKNLKSDIAKTLSIACIGIFNFEFDITLNGTLLSNLHQSITLGDYSSTHIVVTVNCDISREIYSKYQLNSKDEKVVNFFKYPYKGKVESLIQHYCLYDVAELTVVIKTTKRSDQIYSSLKGFPFPKLSVLTIHTPALLSDEMIEPLISDQHPRLKKIIVITMNK